MDLLGLVDLNIAEQIHIDQYLPTLLPQLVPSVSGKKKNLKIIWLDCSALFQS